MQNFTFKIFALLVATFFATDLLRGQFVIVNSPDSLAGSYTYSTGAAFGANLLDSIWTADVALVNDGSNLPTQLCADSVVNDIAGKIALIDRGTCSFVSKLIKAQNAGAVGGIIFNSLPGDGVFAMGGTDPSITMPCVMLSFEDGVKIKAALAAGATVNVSIGNVRFAGDIATSITSIIVAPLGTVPSNQLDNFVVIPGSIITNLGTTDVTGTELRSAIDFIPFDLSSRTTVYQDSFSIGSEVLAVDSAIIVTLTDYTPEEIGYYLVTYGISSDSIDNNSSNNVAQADFAVSKNVFSKARWDEDNQLPVVTGARTISSGGGIEFLAGFDVPNGIGYRMDSIAFYVTVNAADSLGGRIFEGYVYKWTDTNNDNGWNNDELEIVGLGFVEFPVSASEDEAWLRLPLLDFTTFENGYVITQDTGRFIMGARYRGEGSVFFGFDDSYDYTGFQDYKTILGELSESDFSYRLVTDWENDIIPNVNASNKFSGNYAISSAVFVNEIETNVEDLLTNDEFKMEMYPNPVSDQLTTSLRLTERSEFVEYEITDATGRRIFNQRKNGYVEVDNAVFNVTALPAGQYFFTVKTAQGNTTKSFAVKR